MISLIQGKVVSKNEKELVVMTSGGVGYRILASPASLSRCDLDQEVMLETFLSVKEDALDLFGFDSKAEKELFKNFLTVSGVGPKTALHLLSLGSVEETTLAIVRSDLDYLTKVSGIGRKTAERLVVELKNKLKEVRIKNLPGADEGGIVYDDNLTDIMDALETLGYTTVQAREVVKKLDPGGKSREQLLKEALQSIR